MTGTLVSRLSSAPGLDEPLAVVTSDATRAMLGENAVRVYALMAPSSSKWRPGSRPRRSTRLPSRARERRGIAPWPSAGTHLRLLAIPYVECAAESCGTTRSLLRSLPAAEA